MLHRLGYRFTVNGPKNRLLPGRPDIVLPKYRTVIFVHGCFWHGHEHCPHFRLPKSRRDWWKQKIEGNRARDLRNETALRALGWHVVTIWECAVNGTLLRRRQPSCGKTKSSFSFRSHRGQVTPFFAFPPQLVV
jgi:DNA mismatch endonuclease, patch repair protein